MNRLVIIGNGFDLAHGLKTSYMDFINWYWEQRMDALLTEHKPISSDCLCELRIIKTNERPSWFLFFQNCGLWDLINCSWKYPPLEIIRGIKENTDDFFVAYSPLFERIMKSIETKGWVDIENDYYQLLKNGVDNPKCGYTTKELNDQMAFLQSVLIKYLSTIRADIQRCTLFSVMIDHFNPADFSTEGRKKAFDNIGLDVAEYENICANYKKLDETIPQKTMLLSFNYTDTALLYKFHDVTYNYIHGNLSEPKDIIFGYGDDLDKDYQNILDKNDNELLKNVKSVKYLENNHYRKMLEFIQSAPFQVYIMGHSCGNSDRTLLNTIFEHENCVSIKPFYHIWDGNSDNYLELVQNISRNFTDMKLYRDRVVNKTQCEPM